MLMQKHHLIVFALCLIFTSPLFSETRTCEVEVAAYDTQNPHKVIGTFAAGTVLELEEADGQGMIPVTFSQPNGQPVKALCKKDDLFKTKTEVASTTTAKPEVKASPPKTDTSVWITDHAKALQIAKNENKFVLMDFTGSDWCGWCIKLDKEVFDEKEFKEFAKEKLVLLVLDFPRSKSQSGTLKAQNKKLAAEYKISGYPSVVVLNPDGKQVGVTGYIEGGPSAFIQNLEKIMSGGGKKKK
jgi:protein disulfide-isomerase